ncbi:leucine-rich repeat domain-containing protein [candidate division KSB1 bacterium]
MKAIAKHSSCFIIAALYMLFLSGCDHTAGSGFPPTARLGEDQTSHVGQYVILDGTASTAGVGGVIEMWDWYFDDNTPDYKLIQSGDSNSTYEVGFIEEGVYTFYLKVTNNFGLESDLVSTMVTVLPREDCIFEDVNLELKARKYWRLPSEDLTTSILQAKDSLRLAGIRFAVRVVSFAGLEYCVNLEYLSAGHERVVDLSPLTNLTKLKELSLTQHHTFSDISPLAGMTEMRELDLDGNLITDISPLAGMTKLEYLRLDYSPVADISALANMIELREVYFIAGTFADISPISGLENLEILQAFDCKIEDIPLLDNLVNLIHLRLLHNNITDISSLKNVISLKAVELGYNQIEDILPLVENSGIGNGDYVDLSGNPLNEQSVNEYIPALQNRGVNVSY